MPRNNPLEIARHPSVWNNKFLIEKMFKRKKIVKRLITFTESAFELILGIDPANFEMDSFVNSKYFWFFSKESRNVLSMCFVAFAKVSNL